MGVKQRRKIANFLNVGGNTEEYVLMGAGFTDLNESPSAQTTSKRYVNDASATKSITGYDWSTAYTTDQIREEKAVDYICEIGEYQKTGAEAETDYLIVDLDKSAGEEKTYLARKLKVAIPAFLALLLTSTSTTTILFPLVADISADPFHTVYPVVQT